MSCRVEVALSFYRRHLVEPHATAELIRVRTRTRPGLLLVAALCVLPFWASLVFSWTQEEGVEQALLPNGKGADLTTKSCGSCHTVENFIGLRRSSSDWKDTVAVMIGYGAAIDDDDSRVIAEYLGEVFGPDSPPLIDADRARSDDLKKLPGLDVATVEVVLGYRKQNGGFKSIQEVRNILGAERFEKVKGYLTVRKKPGA